MNTPRPAPVELLILDEVASVSRDRLAALRSWSEQPDVRLRRQGSSVVATLVRQEAETRHGDGRSLSVGASSYYPALCAAESPLPLALRSSEDTVHVLTSLAFTPGRDQAADGWALRLLGFDLVSEAFALVRHEVSAATVALPAQSAEWLVGAWQTNLPLLERGLASMPLDVEEMRDWVQQELQPLGRTRSHGNSAPEPQRTTFLIEDDGASGPALIGRAAPEGFTLSIERPGDALAQVRLSLPAHARPGVQAAVVFRDGPRWLVAGLLVPADQPPDGPFRLVSAPLADPDGVVTEALKHGEVRLLHAVEPS